LALDKIASEAAGMGPRVEVNFKVGKAIADQQMPVAAERR
jgi:hypothetical protein